MLEMHALLDANTGHGVYAVISACFRMLSVLYLDFQFQFGLF